jgi:hypothetical protein
MHLQGKEGSMNLGPDLLIVSSILAAGAIASAVSVFVEKIKSRHIEEELEADKAGRYFSMLQPDRNEDPSTQPMPVFAVGLAGPAAMPPSRYLPQTETVYQSPKEEWTWGDTETWVQDMQDRMQGFMTDLIGDDTLIRLRTGEDESAPAVQ